MSQHHERFKNHELHGAIQALDESLNSVGFATEDEHARNGYDRFRRVFEHVKQRVAQADPDLVTEKLLDALTKLAKTINAQHEQFKENNDPTHLIAHTDILLNTMQQWPACTDSTAEYHKSLDDFRTRANDIVEALRSRIVEVRAIADGLTSEIDEHQERLSDHDKQFEQQKGRIDNLINDLQAKFSEAQQQRLSEFNDAEKQRDSIIAELIDTKENEIDTLIEKHSTETAEQHEQINKEAQHRIDTLDDQLAQAKKIVGLIGNTGMTGHYQKVANRDFWAAEILRGIAILIFVLAAVVVWLVVKDIGAKDFSLDIALLRIGVSLALLAPGVYCARESTRHRNHQNRNRRIELELASIKPYLDNLPEDKAQQVIEQLASRYFGNEIASEIESGSDKETLGDVVGWLERLAQVFRK